MRRRSSKAPRFLTATSKAGKAVGRGLVKAIGLSVCLVGLHWYLEHVEAGAHLRRFQAALIQEALKEGPYRDSDFLFGGAKLPLVVDIAKIRGDRAVPVNRKLLDTLISTLKQEEAKAIGLDLEFVGIEPLDADDLNDVDKWNRNGNVRVGVYKRALLGRDRWLGRPEYAAMASGIAIPSGDIHHSFLYSRALQAEPGQSTLDAGGDSISEKERPASMEERKTCLTSGNCLLQLPTALWMLSEQQDRMGSSKPAVPMAQVLANTRVTRPYDWMEFGEYAVDYSYLRDIQNETIHLTSQEINPTLLKRARNRIILIGDMEDVSDQYCDIERGPIPGVLIHASAIATLGRGLFWEVEESWAFELLMILLVSCGVFAVLFTSEYIKGKVKPRWEHNYLEILGFALLSVLFFIASTWQIRTFRVFWPDFLWVSAGLFIHPFLTEPFYRTCLAVPKVCKTFALAFATQQGAPDDH